MSLARRSLQVVAFLCTLIVGTASMAAIITQTAWFKDWLRGFIVRQAEEYVNGQLSIGHLGGNLFFGVELEDVGVTMNGKKVVELKDVGIDYNFLTFLSGDVVLDDIRLTRPVVRAERTSDGWNIARLIKARTPDPDEPKTRRDLAIGEIGVSDATLLIEPGAVGTSGVEVPDRIERLDASVGVKSNADELTIDINHVSLRVPASGFGVNTLSGVVRRTPDTVTLENIALRTDESSLSANGTIRNIESGRQVVDVRVSADKVSFEEIARLVPGLRGYELQPAFEVSAAGPADHLAVTFGARDKTAGEARGDVTLDAAAPGRRVAGTVDLRNLNLAPILRNARLRSDVTGRARIDFRLPEERVQFGGTYVLRASHAAFAGYEGSNVNATGRIDGRTIHVDGSAQGYGANATTTGTIVIGAPLRLDLQGHAADVDLRKVPAQLNAPSVPSNLEFDYKIVAQGPVFSGDARLMESTITGATIASGTTATFRIGDGAPQYSAQGSVHDLDVQQIGEGFAIEVLTQDRFKSRIAGNFTVAGSGGGRDPLTLDVSGDIEDSSIFGASVSRMNVNARIGGGDLQVRAVGQFDGLDPAVPIGQERYQGRLSGALDVDTTMRAFRSGVTIDTLSARGRVNLGPSELAGVAINTAVVEGHYYARQGSLDQFAVEGPDLTVRGSGPVSLADEGNSNVTVHVEAPALDRLADLIGQPFSGGAVIDATVTGNGRELKAAGTLDGSNVARGNINALNLDSRFDAVIPELDAERVTLHATSHATLVEIAGQRINELTADTTYSAPDLTFTTTAKEGVRELTASGRVVLHPDHQEVHLADLAFRTEGVEWRSEPGSKADVQYGRERIIVNNVRLVNGDQRIEADGTVGGDEALDVRMTNVDVAQLDRLLLINHGVGGRLSADARVTGKTSDPRVEGKFTLAAGSFREFTFESLGGAVHYAGKGLTVDARMQQTPTAWLTAKGYLPVSLFRPRPAETGPERHEEPEPGEAVDLDIASSQIDLGVIQGLTTYVTNVTGALQANVKVTGSGHDPHLDGSIDIKGGSFTVPALGTAYTGFDTRIDLGPDTISIQEMRVVDGHQQVMTIGGTLSVHERQVGDVNVAVKSENFEVIGNQIADLKLDTDIQVTGTLRAPKVVGFVEVENGAVDVARLLDQVTSDPYATEAVEYGPKAEEELNPLEPSVFDAVELEVGIGVPSNLVLKGNGLRPRNAPIDIGDINITVGGAVQVRKPPRGQLALVGEVNTVRGHYDFQGRRFEILRDGRIRFPGTEEIDPILDLRTRRIISGMEVYVTVRGTLREPELAFSSVPPQDEADILSLIVFNVPINELGEGQQISLAERAAAFAGGFLASGISRSIAGALEIDEFEIATTDEQGLGASLTVGEQVGDKLFVRLRQAFGTAQATEFILDYQIKDFLRLQGSIAETSGGTQRLTFRRIERGGLDLIFFFSY